VTTERVVTFATQEEKARYLDGRASVEAIHPRVGQLATDIYRAVEGDPDAFSRGVTEWITTFIKYVPDGKGPNGERVKPEGEEFASSATILARGFDDCDGMSKLFVALHRALGFPARIVPAYRGPGFAHVMAQTRNVRSHPRMLPGGWVEVELTLGPSHPFGYGPEDAPKGARSGRSDLG
jgi:transglutaminase-like putative cysteine protease